MRSLIDVWRGLEAFLTSGIAGSAFTPLRLLTVFALFSALVWITRRVTRWLIDRVLARRASRLGYVKPSGPLFVTSS